MNTLISRWVILANLLCLAIPTALYAYSGGDDSTERYYDELEKERKEKEKEREAQGQQAIKENAEMRKKLNRLAKKAAKEAAKNAALKKQVTGEELNDRFSYVIDCKSETEYRNYVHKKSKALTRDAKIVADLQYRILVEESYCTRERAIINDSNYQPLQEEPSSGQR
jgi:hypothetical protein